LFDEYRYFDERFVEERLDEERLAPLFFAEERFAPLFFADERLAPDFLADERLAPDFFADDFLALLFLVAILSSPDLEWNVRRSPGGSRSERPRPRGHATASAAPSLRHSRTLVLHATHERRATSRARVTAGAKGA
jgi:hypothetical protein